MGKHVPLTPWATTAQMRARVRYTRRLHLAVLLLWITTAAAIIIVGTWVANTGKPDATTYAETGER